MSHNTNKDIIPMKKALLIIILTIVALLLLMGTFTYFLFSGSFPIVKNNPAATEDRIEDNIDDADFLNGVWIMETPNNNDETRAITFLGNAYTIVTEMILIAEYDHILAELEHMEVYYSGRIVAEPIDEVSTMIQITTNGHFSFTENEIELTNTAGETSILPFSRTENDIVIDNDVYIRQ